MTVVCSAPCHYINKCWLIFNCTLGNKIKWNWNLYAKFFCHANTFKIFSAMSAILLGPQLIGKKTHVSLTFRELSTIFSLNFRVTEIVLVVRRAGLLWSQQDFEWRWSVPLFKCLTVLEFSFILFDLCLLITFFNFIVNYVPIVTFWIFTYHKIWILSIMFCFIWSYWIIYFLACLEVSWRVVS